jgi:tetratricopeptide (TPR) repeat protein
MRQFQVMDLGLWNSSVQVLLIQFLACSLSLLAADTPKADPLISARDHQDLAAIEQVIRQPQPSSLEARYKLALAYSYGAEIAIEKKDKRKAESMAESGLEIAKKLVSEKGDNAEYHRLLGELCGQVIPANPLMGTLKYGQCARDEINRAIQLNDKLALAYISRGVGNSYLPASMGGGAEVALKDFDKAIALEPDLAEAYLWKGVTLRKANKNAEARQALEHALKLAPDRVWAKEQLDKTPAQ